MVAAVSITRLDYTATELRSRARRADDADAVIAVYVATHLLNSTQREPADGWAAVAAPTGT
jgi:hypothetical protein